MLKKSLTFLSTSLSGLILAPQAFAQGDPLSFSISQPTGVGVSSLGKLISSAFTVAILFAILFVFGMLIMGGYGWLTAGGDKAKVEEARTRITNALVGMAIIASAWVLITIISTFFGVSLTSFSIPPATGQ